MSFLLPARGGRFGLLGAIFTAMFDNIFFHGPRILRLLDRG
jgi:hypothetical protein